MGIIFIIIFVSIYIYQFNYYRKNELPYTTLIVSLILLIIEITYLLNNINFSINYKLSYTNESEQIASYIGYFLGCLSYGIFAIFINYITIYKYKNNYQKIGLVNHYTNILCTANSRCSRSDYWLFYGIYLMSFSIIVVILTLLRISLNSNIYTIIALVLEIINIIFQAKRLNDIGISKYFLLIHLSRLLGISFGFVADIVMLAILCLPAEQIPVIPTTDIHGNNSNNITYKDEKIYK